MRSSRGILFTIGVLALALLVAPQTVSAEGHEGESPSYTMVHYDTVGPANMTEYEENAKAWVAAFKEAGLDDEWTFQTYSGTNFNYAFLTRVPNYAYLDSADERWAAMIEKVGKEKIDGLMAGGGGSTGHRHELMKGMPELSYTPEGGMGEVGFVHVMTHHVKPGMEDQVQALFKKVHDARVKLGTPHAVRFSEIQFGNGTFSRATLAKDRAAYYNAKTVGQILREAYGDEETQAMFDEWRNCITGFESSTWTFEPELSYIPAMYAEQETMKQGAE